MRWCLALHFGYVEVFDNDHPVALGDGSCELVSRILADVVDSML